MSLRLVLFSDTHLGFDYPVRRSSGSPTRRRRGEDFFRNFEAVLAYAQRERPDVLVHCGDLFHRSQPHPVVIDRAYAALLACADTGVQIVIVPGNHERSTLPPSLFLQHPNIHIFDRVRCFDLSTASGQVVSVGGFPYQRKVAQSFETLLRAIQDQQRCSDYRLLCFHHAVAGCVVGAGAGQTDYVFRHGTDVIPATAVPSGFDLVLSGHIHRAQQLALASPVLYCGSTERTSFAEWREAKSFCDVYIPGWQLAPEITHVQLPSRSMHPIDARHCSDARALQTYLADQLPATARFPLVRAQVPDYLPAAEVRRIERKLGCSLQLVVRSHAAA